MGRAKLKVELIEKEKSREQTFKKRKEGLIRKLAQLTVLCDVSACAIIYGPKRENGIVEPEIWPQSRDEVLGVIDMYKERKGDSGNRTYGVKDYFSDRKKSVEDKLKKLRKKNMEEKYPTELVIFNSMTEGELRRFAEELRKRAEHVRSKIEFLKGNGVVDANNLMHFGKTGLNGPFYPPPPPLVPMHTPIPIQYHHQQLHAFNQNNSMMMLLKNGGDQFGGGSTSRGNFQSASFWSQVSYEASASSSRGRGVVDPVIYHDPRLLACYDRFSLTKYGQKDIMGATTHPRINTESDATSASYFSSMSSNYSNIRMDHSSLALQPHLPEKMISNSSCTSTSSYPNAESGFLIDQVAFDSGLTDAANYFSREQGSPKSKTM